VSRRSGRRATASSRPLANCLEDPAAPDRERHHGRGRAGVRRRRDGCAASPTLLEDAFRLPRAPWWSAPLTCRRRGARPPAWPAPENPGRVRRRHLTSAPAGGGGPRQGPGSASVRSRRQDRVAVSGVQAEHAVGDRPRRQAALAAAPAPGRSRRSPGGRSARADVNHASSPPPLRCRGGPRRCPSWPRRAWGTSRQQRRRALRDGQPHPVVDRRQARRRTAAPPAPGAGSACARPAISNASPRCGVTSRPVATAAVQRASCIGVAVT